MKIIWRFRKQKIEVRLINVPEVILQPMNIVEKISAQINNMVSGGEKTKETPTKIVKRRSETVEKEKNISICHPRWSLESFQTEQ